MKHFKKKTLAVMTLAMGIGVGAQGTAQATVMADAILELTNFRFTDDAGNIITVGADIGDLVGSNNANADASIDAIEQAANNNSGLGNPLNLPQQCVGACPAGTGDNDFRAYETIFGAVPPNTEVSFADTNLQGSAVAGFDAPTGADASTRATSALIDGDIGDSNSNIGLLVSFNFTALADTSFGFSTNFDITSRAFVSSDEAPGSSAQASVGWLINLTETDSGKVVSQISPLELQRTSAALNPGENSGVNNTVGSISYTDLTGGAGLIEGTRYTLNLRHQTQVDTLREERVVPAPEPATIALLGVGLLGVAVSRQRSRKGSKQAAA